MFSTAKLLEIEPGLKTASKNYETLVFIPFNNYKNSYLATLKMERPHCFAPEVNRYKLFTREGVNNT